MTSMPIQSCFVEMNASHPAVIRIVDLKKQYGRPGYLPQGNFSISPYWFGKNIANGVNNFDWL